MRIAYLLKIIRRDLTDFFVMTIPWVIVKAGQNIRGPKTPQNIREKSKEALSFKKPNERSAS